MNGNWATKAVVTFALAVGTGCGGGSGGGNNNTNEPLVLIPNNGTNGNQTNSNPNTANPVTNNVTTDTTTVSTNTPNTNTPNINEGSGGDEVLPAEQTETIEHENFIGFNSLWQIKHYDGAEFDGVLELVNMDTGAGTAFFQWYDYDTSRDCLYRDAEWDGRVQTSASSDSVFFKFTFNNAVPEFLFDLFQNQFSYGESSLVSNRAKLIPFNNDFYSIPACSNFEGTGTIADGSFPDGVASDGGDTGEFSLCDETALDTWEINCELRQGGLYAQSVYTAGVQKILACHGYLAESEIDGIYGPITSNAVAQYQDSRPISGYIVGVVDTATWESLRYDLTYVQETLFYNPETVGYQSGSAYTVPGTYCETQWPFYLSGSTWYFDQYGDGNAIAPFGTNLYVRQ